MPPENKPTPAEIATCRPFLAERIASHAERLRAIVVLGRIAHDSTLAALGAQARPSTPSRTARATTCRAASTLFDSFHCSRYNTNTGRLTPECFAPCSRAIEHCEPGGRRRG